MHFFLLFSFLLTPLLAQATAISHTCRAAQNSVSNCVSTSDPKARFLSINGKTLTLYRNYKYSKFKGITQYKGAVRSRNLKVGNNKISFKVSTSTSNKKSYTNNTYNIFVNSVKVAGPLERKGYAEATKNFSKTVDLSLKLLDSNLYHEIQRYEALYDKQRKRYKSERNKLKQEYNSNISKIETEIGLWEKALNDILNSDYNQVSEEDYDDIPEIKNLIEDLNAEFLKSETEMSRLRDEIKESANSLNSTAQLIKRKYQLDEQYETTLDDLNNELSQEETEKPESQINDIFFQKYIGLVETTINTLKDDYNSNSYTEFFFTLTKNEAKITFYQEYLAEILTSTSDLENVKNYALQLEQFLYGEAGIIDRKGWFKKTNVSAVTKQMIENISSSHPELASQLKAEIHEKEEFAKAFVQLSKDWNAFWKDSWEQYLFDKRKKAIDAQVESYRLLLKQEQEVADFFVDSTKNIINTALGLYPPTSLVKHLYEGITGRSAVDDSEISDFNRFFSIGYTLSRGTLKSFTKYIEFMYPNSKAVPLKIADLYYVQAHKYIKYIDNVDRFYTIIQAVGLDRDYTKFAKLSYYEILVKSYNAAYASNVNKQIINDDTKYEVLESIAKSMALAKNNLNKSFVQMYTLDTVKSIKKRNRQICQGEFGRGLKWFREYVQDIDVEEEIIVQFTNDDGEIETKTEIIKVKKENWRKVIENLSRPNPVEVIPSEHLTPVQSVTCST
jgi:hypothetical protein